MKFCNSTFCKISPRLTDQINEKIQLNLVTTQSHHLNSIQKENIFHNIKEKERANSLLGGILTIIQLINLKNQSISTIIMIFTLIYYLGALIKNLNNEKVYFALMDIFIYMDKFIIMVQVCDNTTSNQCKSLDEINNLINSGIKIDLFIQEARIRSKFNESSPGVQYSSNIYWKLNNLMADNEDIYIVTIAQDLKKSYFFEYTKGKEYQNKKGDKRQLPLTMEQLWHQRESTNFQYYFVVQQDYTVIVFSAVSQASGLCLALLEFIKCFYFYYSSHYTFETIMNNVYQFNLRSIKK